MIEPPQILLIYREFWKPGHETDLNRIEAEAARVCIGLGCPHPYLGIESLSDSKEVWYMNGFASSMEVHEVTQAYNANPALMAAMGRFNQERDPFRARPDWQGFVHLRPELSRGVPWSMGQAPLMTIAVTGPGPCPEGTVFEAEDGTRFTIAAAKTRAEADAKLVSAGPDARIFTYRADFSMPAPEWMPGLDNRLDVR